MVAFFIRVTQLEVVWPAVGIGRSIIFGTYAFEGKVGRPEAFVEKTVVVAKTRSEEMLIKLLYVHVEAIVNLVDVELHMVGARSRDAYLVEEVPA